MKESKGVGGTSVLLVPGRVKGDQESHKHVWDRSIEQIRQLLPLAEKLKIHILIETVWNGFCYKPEEFRDYIDAIDSPWVQAYYDIGNMQKFAPSHEWIRILGKRTLKLDVKDWGSKNGFCPLGKGDVDWKKVVKFIVIAIIVAYLAKSLLKSSGSSGTSASSPSSSSSAASSTSTSSYSYSLSYSGSAARGAFGKGMFRYAPKTSVLQKPWFKYTFARGGFF